MANSSSFGNLMDYIAWRGDLPFSQAPCNEIDCLLLAMLSYQRFGPSAASREGVPLHELASAGLECPRDVPFERHRIEMLEKMALAPRYRSMRVFLQESATDVSASTQFSAVSCEIPGEAVVIAYRGTDHTLVGWKEDFMMSYLSPVPAQSAAVEYLEKVARLSEAPLILTGHSKGGNLAAYAAAHADESIQKRLIQVCSYDGPGLDDETIDSQGYERIRPILHSVIPSGSVVGLLMNYHPDYTVVLSTTVGLFQHDPYTWKLLGGSFLTADETTRTSQLMNDTVHEWLKNSSPEEVRGFVETLFTTLEKLYPRGGSEDLYEIQLVNMADAAAFVRTVAPEKRNMIVSLLTSLFAIGKDNYLQIMLQKPLESTLSDLQSRLKSLQIPGFLPESENVKKEKT